MSLIFYYSVEKTTDSKIQVLSKIYKVEAFDSNGRVLFPKENKEFIQYSFAYLVVNVKTRTVALFYHNVGETIYTWYIYQILKIYIPNIVNSYVVCTYIISSNINMYKFTKYKFVFIYK